MKIKTKNENEISLNVHFRRSRNHVMNFERIVVKKIFAMEQNDDGKLEDDPQLD